MSWEYLWDERGEEQRGVVSLGSERAKEGREGRGEEGGKGNEPIHHSEKLLPDVLSRLHVSSLDEVLMEMKRKGGGRRRKEEERRSEHPSETKRAKSRLVAKEKREKRNEKKELTSKHQGALNLLAFHPLYTANNVK